MSHQAYDEQWQGAMTDLLEQVQLEHLPAEKVDSGTNEFDRWSPARKFQHYAVLYIRYLDILKRLDECYDQIVQPQKRRMLKTVLESTIARVCELKDTLILLNPRPASIYVNLDDLLMDLKVDPTSTEVPIPRYFREDNREYFEKRKQLLDQLLIANFGTDNAEEEVVLEAPIVELNEESAIRIIQKYDRGRQGRERCIKAKEFYANQKRDEERKLRAAKGLENEQDEDPQAKNALIIMKVFKSFLAWKEVQEMRRSELEFLGMALPVSTVNDPRAVMDKIKDRRRLQRVEYHNEYEDAIEELKTVVMKTEGLGYKEKMLTERRDWIIQHMQRHEGKPPEKPELFYTRADEERLLSSEEEAKKKLEEEEAKKAAADAKKKAAKKGGDKKKAAGKKGNAKKVEEKPKPDNTIWIPSSNQIQTFQENVEKYKNEWEQKDESLNPAQRFDEELAKELVRPEIMEIIRAGVDEILKVDLENLKTKKKATKKGRKKGKKKGKKGKGKKGKGKKGKPAPGAKLVGKRQPDDLCAELVSKGVLRKLVPCKISDFLGSFDYMGSQMQHGLTLANMEPKPSYAQVRQVISELAILPMGSPTIRQSLPFLTNSLLLYGPAGCGKTMLARAISYHTNAYFVDISPSVIGPKLEGDSKVKAITKMLYMAFHVAKEFQPAVIYMDEVEKVFPGGKKKKGSKSDPISYPKMLKDLIAHRKLLKKEHQVIFIGTTKKPWDCNLVKVKSFFSKRVWIPHPDFTTRRQLWEHFITSEGGVITKALDISTLAQLTEGYTAGTILQCIRKVLSDRRKEFITLRPLLTQEFIPLLSRTSFVSSKEFAEYEKVTYNLLGIKALYEAELKAQEAAENPQGKGDKKGGKSPAKGDKKKKPKK